MPVIHKETYLSQRWYAVPNDLIGGWCVVLEDKPLGDQPLEFTIADATNKPLAKHIAFLHNQWLEHGVKVRAGK